MKLHLPSVYSRVFTRWRLCRLAILSWSVLTTLPARAQNVISSFGGTVSGPTMIDTAGLFGPAGANLAGLPFQVQTTYVSADFTAVHPNVPYFVSLTPRAMTLSVTINGITQSQTSLGKGREPASIDFEVDGDGTFVDFSVDNYLTGADPKNKWIQATFVTMATPTLGNPGLPVLGGCGSINFPIGENIPIVCAQTPVIISPFLLGAKNLGDIDLNMLLPALQQSATALGLAADGASAAIVLFQVPTKASVTFTTNNGTTLVDYDPKFLTYEPTPGNATLTVTPIKIGSILYAVALLQAPPAIVAPNYATPITITAQQQGGQAQQAYLPLVPPPVVLVHGIWGDQTSLASLQGYLASQAPWSENPAFVNTLCYSKNLKFDAASDPLTSGQLCEVTSKVALQTTITPLLGNLNSEGVVVGRVDIVGHSMGGLAARNYASQSFYRSKQNRGEGQFHTVITLDTPEVGSELATFLFSHRGAHLQRAHDTVWTNFCGQGVTGPIESCFAQQGLPVTTPGVPLTAGAVYSLLPTSSSLLNKKLSAPAIPDVLWLDVSAVAPNNSATEALLNDLLTEITPKGETAPTITSILHTTSHDAIVTTQSQTAGTGAGQTFQFQQLSHSSLSNNGIIETLIQEFGWNDSSVVNDPNASVNKLVSCWLQTIGSAICSSAQAEEIPKASQSSHLDPAKTVPYSVDVRLPASAVLGKPIEIGLPAAAVGEGKTIEVALQEVDGYNHGKLETVLTDRVSGGVAYAQVTPMVLGNVRVHVVVDSSDGRSMGIGDAKIFVQLPETPPMSFKLSKFPTLYIDLDADEPIVVTTPTATFQGVPGELLISNEFLTFNLAAGSSTSVVSVSKGGLIRGLHEGSAKVEAHLGSSVQTVDVVVQHQPP